MKSVLYVGATLMIGASIYGFVDYRNTSHKKEFSSMYAEEERKAPVVFTDDKTTEPVVKKSIAVKEKKMVSKKPVSPKDETGTIAAIKPIAEDEKIATREIIEIESSPVDLETSKESGVEKKVKKKKKLNHKIFSRAPLRDREEINLVEPPKSVVKKTEIKGQ